MTLTLLLLIFIFIAFFSVLTIILATVKKGAFSKRPYLQSIIVCILFFTNWILYLTSFYTLFPEKINGFLFLPIWFFLCILGFIAFWREWRNNRVFSICIGFLSFISFLFGLFFLLLSGM
ncbi:MULTISPECIES: hypothetical protein [Bacillus cereus group]|uniref:hypothetical protein n=1 Tax=Bacillus cereus group TaxID=86661 RepID=UPI000945D22B|nr:MULTISPECIES: hypothetical protein [Bacillus cereus group]PEB08786.1 hypothetical protein COM56_01100 [Bacillus cereus]MCZ7520991.1 hypothetical protein [Bacillus pacificus]MDA1572051.1 hypothetical protein [Bacillus cereus group sp. TH242-3LC]MED1584003.1 hypothetical protein [Bacillus pacificus]RRB06006.1 hypothetical protein EH195_11640 [Bacillus pacificus]